ncbi:hypothetical protein L249_1795 [Ophiocordyceps polyrhachis-furcata BCC 54312]|uniref:Response regulatory domain-containing protein n=1 Tax=Ophiocordyceps polyrhachis-furcata BCC 54312 TaxID=1330021 RepID=A0A367LRJ2_9HYPO|nr:hypothetical protein L249_1795 [Ophiocordyceps polyrhachis-furcata BCC 54312]
MAPGFASRLRARIFLRAGGDDDSHDSRLGPERPRHQRPLQQGLLAVVPDAYPPRNNSTTSTTTTATSTTTAATNLQSPPPPSSAQPPSSLVPPPPPPPPPAESSLFRPRPASSAAVESSSSSTTTCHGHDNRSMSVAPLRHRRRRSDMVTRKVWVKRPNGSATTIVIHEDDLVDDVRDLILRRYANSLGRTFDSPDLSIRICGRDQDKDRLLGPEETMTRTLDRYYPGGQTVDEALLIDIPRRTPKPSPMVGAPTTAYYVAEDGRPSEAGEGYFPPVMTAPSPARPSHSVPVPANGGSGFPHAVATMGHPIAVFGAGHLPPMPSHMPPVPSPGAISSASASVRPRLQRERSDRPRLARQHTSSPTTMAAHTATGMGTGTGTAHYPQRVPHSRTHSSSSEHQQPPIMTPKPMSMPMPKSPGPGPEPTPARAVTPPPRVTSPRFSTSRVKKGKKSAEYPASQASGMLNGVVPPISVLIVEDNPINLKLLEAFVKRLKVRWQTAMNGRDAVAKWRTGGFHLVLMDIQLPVMNGLDATREIRRLERVNSIGIFSSSTGSVPEKTGDELKEQDRLDKLSLFKSPVIIRVSSVIDGGQHANHTSRHTPPSAMRASKSSASVLTDAILLRPKCSLPGPGWVARQPFSTTPCRSRITRERFMMHQWLKSPEGNKLWKGDRGVQYINGSKDQPFPLNPLFRSQPVLDNQTREIIWKKVVQDGEAIKAVSALMGVDVRRVAAVVRLKEVERKFPDYGKKLATPYAEAVLSMLPKTSWREGKACPPHEPINDIHVHKNSMHQLFLPVSESRHFTRADAAEAFGRKLLSVDKRSPQRLLIQMEREILSGEKSKEAFKRFRERAWLKEKKYSDEVERRREKRMKSMTSFQATRVEYRFKHVSVDDVGKDGRSMKGTGWRYGAPLQDRKRGIVKIPTTVPAEPWKLLSSV